MITVPNKRKQISKQDTKIETNDSNLPILTSHSFAQSPQLIKSNKQNKKITNHSMSMAQVSKHTQ